MSGFWGRVICVRLYGGEEGTDMWIGSQEREVIHFEWPFSASPMGLPVLGSQRRTCGEGVNEFYKESKVGTHVSIVPASGEFSLHCLPLYT